MCQKPERMPLIRDKKNQPFFPRFLEKSGKRGIDYHINSLPRQHHLNIVRHNSGDTFLYTVILLKIWRIVRGEIC